MAKNSNSELLGLIKQEYPEAKCELNFENNYQLIVAVILSAQCTDKRVNQITPKLFAKYPTVESLAKADISQLQEIIMPCGFFNNKSKNLISMAQDVSTKFAGEIPNNKQQLVSLAGVGEKTANVVLATAFKVPAIAVDTHVFRVSNRLGLANATTVSKTQKQLETRVNKADWINLHHALVLHGRYVCKAINPQCEKCKFAQHCKFFVKKSKNK